MTRVLGVVGSPRRDGNTHILVSKILEGARDTGSEGSLLFLADRKIQECDGCFTCWESGECCLQDDMIGIYREIMDADVVVFGTPVYWWGPTALMKAFLDRFICLNRPENQARMKKKSAALAIPFEDEALETADPLVAMFEKSFGYLNMNLVGKILVPGVGPKGKILEKKGHLKEAYDLGARLAKHGSDR